MKINREWINISDLMSGLMMVFLFVSVSFMTQIQDEKTSMAEIAITYQQSKEELHKELKNEFDNNLAAWGAEILPDNTVRFQEPEVLFAPNSSQITPVFQNILRDFFPRYIAILTKPQFRNDIDEVRIEGHTSSEWYQKSSPEISYVSNARLSPAEMSYINNARLSQDRSFSVLRFVYVIPELAKEQQWLTTVLRANGLSFAKRIFDDTGAENPVRSRRVEFRVITKTEEKIYTILEKSGSWNK